MVNETWSMSFQGHFYEGYRYFYAEKIRISDFKVFSEGRELSSQQVSGGTEPEFTWAIDVTDSDEIYLMQYKIEKAFKPEPDHDLLYYTVVFKDRPKPVEHVSFEIIFPKEINLDQISHRTTHGTLQQTGPRTLYLEYNNLPPNTPLDLEIKLLKGIVEIQFDWLEFILVTLFNLLILGSFIAIVVLIIWSLYYMYSEWEKYGRDPEVVHKSKMLANLKPAIAGLIVDEDAGINEIIATIIDLAIRGYIKIKETKSFFGLVKAQELTKLKSDFSNLEDYEAEIMKKLFGTKRSLKEKVNTSELRYKFYKHIKKITVKMDKAALRAGLFDKDPKKVKEKYMWDFMKRPLATVGVYGLVIISLVFFGILGITTGYLNVAVMIILAFIMAPAFPILFILFIIAFTAANYMPRKSHKGVEMKNKYDDLENWMQTYPLKRQRLFDEFLPYAIAFGIGDVWVEKMEALGVIKRDWYSGNLTSSSYLSFRSSMRNSLASSPSSSGGGGGFGGGGGAGGGGGGFR
jgi:uncharacterized membrane protein